MFFTLAPIATPDPKHRIALTTEVSPRAKPEDGGIVAILTDKDGDILVESDTTLNALILSGMPAGGIRDADQMIALLDRCLRHDPQWLRERKKMLRPPAEPVVDAKASTQTRRA